MPYLLRTAPANIILGSDSNCVQQKTDPTGHYNYSRALDELVQGFTLKDTWQADPALSVYTHYTPTGASRIDRIYTSHEMFAMKIDVETVAAAFTDHLAVVTSTGHPHPAEGQRHMETEHRLTGRERMQVESATALGELEKAERAISRDNHVVGKVRQKENLTLFLTRGSRTTP